MKKIRVIISKEEPKSTFGWWHVMWLVVGLAIVAYFVHPALICLGGGIALAAAGDKI
jgi:hypothetical protein